MPAAREQLFASTFWSVRRPKFPLTQGHYVIRLNDPSIAFSRESAADLLRCYGRLRRALAGVAGATAAQLYMALNWQPVGDAVGEPLAETSTPTLHTFFFIPGSTTASSVLRLSAHERVAVGDTCELDRQLRAWQQDAAANESAQASEPESCRPDPAFRIEPRGHRSGEPLACAQWTATPCCPAAALDHLEPAVVLNLAATMAGPASRSRPHFQGMTLWATDAWDSPAPATINIFARRHGRAPRHLANFVADGGLELPQA